MSYLKYSSLIKNIMFSFHLSPGKYNVQYEYKCFDINYQMFREFINKHVILSKERKKFEVIKDLKLLGHNETLLPKGCHHLMSLDVSIEKSDEHELLE